MSDFVHLHVHSHYSLLDGLPKIPELVAAAKKHGMTALGLTDHGALYGALEFYKHAKRAGIKPIIGVECYLAPGDLQQKSPAAADYFHLTLLARNAEGYRNLLELVTIANLEGYYYRPRIDKPTLLRLRGGLIGLSGCLRGDIPRAIAGKNLERARSLAQEYQNIFEPESFYLEVQRNAKDPDQNPEQEMVNQGLVKLGRELNIPIVATNDVHYLETGDSAAQDILVCVGTGRTVDDPDRLDMRGSDLHMRSSEEMQILFADLPEAFANTSKIAGMVNLELTLERRHFPNFPLPDGETPEEHFEKLCREGLLKRYNPGPIPIEVTKRLDYEMDVIKRTGYITYLLVVADFVNWSRGRGIISTTRGSAAGSLAAYALGITTINPVNYKLPFERFLNLSRPSPPDVDMDFADNRRDEVLQYVSEKYGKNKVAQIVTFGTMMARAAVRDVGRALGLPYSKCDRIAKMIPFGKQGFHMSIERALAISPELRETYEKDDETRNLIELAKKVEGCARHASVHAAGVVIAPTMLTDFTPLQMDTDNRNVITQYDMHSVEDAGLVKMDFLGIRNLSILGNAVEIVRATKNVDIDLISIPLDDKKTFSLLASGRTIGVFQLGGSGMTKYLVDLKPTNIFDIMAMISLYRPGPMESIPEYVRRKHNPKLISYLDPRLRGILETSYGVLTYQDDVLLIAIELAGYTWEEADKLRKAMGKKIPKEMADQKEKFIQGAIDKGLSSEKAVKLWGLIEPFAAYGFNKAHAASYGMVAYQTAYMKANYSVEFMAAVLSAESDDNEKVAEAVAECHALGIAVLPPDVNESLASFTVINEKEIRFGLTAVKNLGSDVIAAVIAERAQNGPFRTLTDFLRRVQTKNFNKKSWDALVRSGSLDRFSERNQMLLNTENILEFARSHKNQGVTGQSMLFSGEGGEGEISLKPTPPATQAERLSWEKELLGLYVSAHPLDDYRETLRSQTAPITGITPDQDGEFRTVGGIITRVQRILTKKNEQMCFADIEGTEGKIELVVFPNSYNQYRPLLENDQLVFVFGKISEKDGEPKLLVEKMQSLRDPLPSDWATVTPRRNNFAPRETVPLPVEKKAPETTTKLLRIKIPKDASPTVFSKLKVVFDEHRGETPVSLVIPDREGKEREVKTNFTVNGSEEFKAQLRELLRESLRT
ncbi:MAG: polymerase III, alpha subunit protein [Parcubacteria group bacterium GW2011_GWA2_51_12]|nr:MAG: polymerase III, alpha subunit protein [Parcubacteria group bacterium GW2011_GWA2_51_12]